MRGAFVAVSGCPGSGKTTVARALAAALRKRGKDTVVVEPLKANTRALRRLSALRPPTGESWDVRDRWMAEYLSLHLADVAKDAIVPALERGECVVADRWTLDHEINQAFFGVATRSGGILADLPEPDLTVVLHVPVPLALERSSRSDSGPFSRDVRFLRYAADKYRAALADGNTLLGLDGARPASELAASTLLALSRGSSRGRHTQ